MLSSDLPTLTVGDDVRHQVDIISFNDASYAQYLRERHIPDKEIAKVALRVTNLDISMWGKAKYGYERQDDERLHIIRLSPYCITNDLHEQGRVLRHESEHLIHNVRWPFGERVRIAQILAGAAVGGAVFGGYLAATTYVGIHEALRQYPKLLREVSAATGATMLGASSFAVSAYMFLQAGKQFGPWELLAQRAEKKRQRQLPDGTLQFAYTSHHD